MDAQPTVSVVVPTHNRRDRLPTLLEALSSDPADEVLVVANGSSDGSMELLRTWARRDPRIKPIGISIASKTAALQEGVERAFGEVVLLLDDDVIPEPGLSAGHARRHRVKTGLVVAGYMPVARPARRRPGEFAAVLYSDSYERVCDEYEEDPATILRSLWGGNISLRKEDALRVGLDSPDTMPEGGWYHEDLDFGLRCADAGLQAVFDRSLVAHHDHRATAADYARTARDSGQTRWFLHQTHAETLGPLPNDFYVRGTPMPGRLLVRLSRHGPGERIARASLRAIARVAGALHVFRLETHAGYLMGRIEQQRGAREAARAFAEGAIR